jgi:hypothetical protein
MVKWQVHTNGFIKRVQEPVTVLPDQGTLLKCRAGLTKLIGQAENEGDKIRLESIRDDIDLLIKTF